MATVLEAVCEGGTDPAAAHDHDVHSLLRTVLVRAIPNATPGGQVMARGRPSGSDRTLDNTFGHILNQIEGRIQVSWVDV
ncbi:hypothetical protein GCM10023317_35700 [Actinopolymorpha pittospori]